MGASSGINQLEQVALRAPEEGHAAQPVAKQLIAHQAVETAAIIKCQGRSVCPPAALG